MIRQHYLQQQRLGENHARLLNRYQRLLAPTTSQFRTFGTSSLPGRNYEQMFQSSSDKKRYEGMSLATLSRNGLGTKNETYQWTIENNSESLPNNVNSIVQHNRRHVPPLVQADRFEPVQVYEHPVFGPTPAYLRPVSENGQNDDLISQNDLESERGDIEETSQPATSPKSTRSDLVDVVNDDNDDSNAPRGYISYKKWKNKYENLIPVDPLMYNIYKNRPNGSVHHYGQSIYNSLNRQNPNANRNSPTLSRSSSTSSLSSSVSEKPKASTSIASKTEYQKFQPKLFGQSNPFSLTGYVPPDELKPTLNDERRQPDLESLSVSRDISGNPLRIDSQVNSTKPMTQITDNKVLNSTIPAAPPLPTSLLSTSSAPTYQTPPSLSITSANGISPSTNNSVGVYQTPSSLAMGTKAVTFGTTTGTTTNNDDELSSSSDSDDDDETKKKKRQKKRRAAGLPDDNDSSSSDD